MLELCKELEISQQTYYRWRQKSDGMSPNMIKQFKALQKENAQLKKLVADQALIVCENIIYRPRKSRLTNL